MGAIRNIIVRFGPSYLERFGERMPDSHRRALFDIVSCRSNEMGGHLRECENCGETEFVPHSCRDRMCPQCHRAEIDDWIAARALEILPARYFHLTFTLRASFRRPVRQHQKQLEDALIRSAAEAVQTLAADRLHGRLGFIAAIHTWGRLMSWHPHVHILVPALVVHDDNTFSRPRAKRSLLPLKPLSRVFAGIFVREFRKALPDEPPPRELGDWVVNSRLCGEGPGRVIAYHGRYAKRAPLADSAIVSVDDSEIVFRYKDYRSGDTRLCRVTPDEFIRRFLQHTPPPGFHRLRYYGFLAPGARRTLRAIRAVLLDKTARLANLISSLQEPALNRPPTRCPACGGTEFHTYGFAPCLGRPPVRGPP